jgi:hypothetical protein
MEDKAESVLHQMGMAALVGLGLVLSPSPGQAQSSTELGDSSATAAASADSLKAARPNAVSGVYWFDPDGAGGNAPFQTYADLTTNGGGWMQVRRVAGSGSW